MSSRIGQTSGRPIPLWDFLHVLRRHSVMYDDGIHILAAMNMSSM